MLILGIETSCDETAAAVVEDGREILSSCVASQVKDHKAFGGVVPEIASRKHLETINFIIEQALGEAKIGFKDLQAVAVTYGPGLAGALLIGIAAAKAISFVHKIPLIGVNHLEGHIYSAFLEDPTLSPPAIALIVSGGHTSLIYVKELGNYEVLGQTRDDAAGEVFDKVAKMMDLGYPGGPIIDSLAKKGDVKAIKFPQARLKSGSPFDFSFSGVKTSVLYYLKYTKKEEIVSKEDIAASFQYAVVEALVKKSLAAAKKKKADKIILGGGVAANSYLRQVLKERAEKEGISAYSPSLSFCTDNAVMIAGLGFVRYKLGDRSPFSLNACPNLSL